MNRLRYFEDVITLSYDREKCNGCAICVAVCPHAVFMMVDKRAVLQDRGACMECGACALNCSEGAITAGKGVGCAAAVITGFFNRSAPTCDCSDGRGAC